MQIDSFDWNKWNIEHIARHSVTPDEVEETADNRPLIYKGRGGSFLLLGRADSGRFLFVVFKYLGEKQAKVITARDMSEKEKRLYKRRKENE